MSVTPTVILFNHDPTSSRRSALNIRRNFYQAAAWPEWRTGFVRHDQSQMAYAVREVDPERLYIQAKFESPTLRQQTIQVRTVRPRVPSLPVYWQDALNQQVFFSPWLYYAWRTYLDYWWTLAWELQDNILGTVPPTEVTLAEDGVSDWATLPLRGHTLNTAGVGMHRIGLHWQYRTGAGRPWQDIGPTYHTVYTVLHTPTAPWLQVPFRRDNTQLPWTDALEHACTWAAGAERVEGVADRVTRTIYNFGGDYFQYGCPINAVTVYSQPYFNLTAFLDRIAGGIGRGPYVNCSDCATFVSTFANLLGADLWQSQMRSWEHSFPVNPIRAIGTSLWEPPCGIGLFSYHEVAWTGQATVDDRVYDACLEVDAELDRYRFFPMLPVNVRFGEPGEGQYRDLLAAPWGRELCEAKPDLKQRRFVI